VKAGTGRRTGDAPSQRRRLWRYDTPRPKKFETVRRGGTRATPWGMELAQQRRPVHPVAAGVNPATCTTSSPGGRLTSGKGGGQRLQPLRRFGEIKEICDPHPSTRRAAGAPRRPDLPRHAADCREKYRNSVIFGSIHGCSIKQNILKKNGFDLHRQPGATTSWSAATRTFPPDQPALGGHTTARFICIDLARPETPCHQAGGGPAGITSMGRVFRIQAEGVWKTKKAEDMSQMAHRRPN